MGSEEPKQLQRKIKNGQRHRTKVSNSQLKVESELIKIVLKIEAEKYMFFC